MKKTFLDSIANSFAEAKAWKMATLVMSVFCGVLLIALLYQARNAPVILVPYDFASAQGPQKIQPNGDFAVASPDFLAQNALGDLNLILTFTPETTVVQTQRFLNRMTPELYAEQNVELLQKAAEYKSGSVSESFYPLNTRVSGKNQVVVDGTLVRWTAEKESLRMKVTFIITYETYKGYLHVAGLRIQK